ncbi:MAG: hypothetical protein ACP5UV_01020 [Thermoplasmata archaeon]
MSIDFKRELPNDVVVILSSVNDDIDVPNQIKANTATEAIRKAIPRLLNKENFDNLIVGIDPGPKPGVAVLGDDILIEAFECPEVFTIDNYVASITKSYSYNDVLIKVGNGDKPNREIILSRLASVDAPVMVVNEKNTSTPHKVHDNALSAARIALIEGKYPQKRIPVRFSRKDVYDKEFTTLRSVIKN